jgi:hypothetical protein
VAKGRCIRADIEIMPQVLGLMREYKRLHPKANDKDAYGAAYLALREEMVRQTLALKENISYGRNI